MSDCKEWPASGRRLLHQDPVGTNRGKIECRKYADIHAMIDIG
jgi:hypothetical protein